MARINFESGRVVRPGLADRLEGRLPPDRLQALGEVLGLDEGKRVRLGANELGVMGDVDGSVLYCPVHPFGLTVGQPMVGLGQTMIDAWRTRS